MVTLLFLVSAACLGLCAFLYERERRRRVARQLAIRHNHVQVSLSAHGGNAYKAAMANPLNGELVTMAIEQEKNYRELFDAKTGSLNAALNLAQVMEKEKHFHRESELSEIEHSVIKQTKNNHLTRLQYAGQRIPLEHAVKMAKLDRRLERLKRPPVKKRSHPQRRGGAEQPVSLHTEPQVDQNVARMEKQHEYAQKKAEHNQATAKKQVLDGHELEKLRQQLELERLVEAQEWLYNKQQQLALQYGEEKAAGIIEATLTALDEGRLDEYQQQR